MPAEFPAVSCSYNDFIIVGSDKAMLHEQLCLIVDTTPIGAVLKRVDGTDSNNFYQRYLHDFVRLVHKCNHKQDDDQNREYEVSLSPCMQLSIIN